MAEPYYPVRVCDRRFGFRLGIVVRGVPLRRNQSWSPLATELRAWRRSASGCLSQSTTDRLLPVVSSTP
jgi:hypothetical protein